MPESYFLFPYFCSTVLVDPFDPYSPFKFLIFIILVCKLFIGYYNNHSGAYIAATQNYTGAYIIMASLQVLVNNLLVWQSSCASKLRPLKATNIFVQPLVDVQLIIRNIDKRLARKLVWRVNWSGVRD